MAGIGTSRDLLYPSKYLQPPRVCRLHTFSPCRRKRLIGRCYELHFFSPAIYISPDYCVTYRGCWKTAAIYISPDYCVTYRGCWKTAAIYISPDYCVTYRGCWKTAAIYISPDYCVTYRGCWKTAAIYISPDYCVTYRGSGLQKNHDFFLKSIFLIFIENIEFCNKKHDFYQKDKKIVN